MPPTRYAPSTYGSHDQPQDGSASRRADKQRRKRRGDPLWARLLVILGAVLLMASGGTIVGEKILVGKVDSQLNKKNLLAPGHHVSIKGPVNILLVGVDTRKNNPSMGTRSDSIIIAHIPEDHSGAYLISIPRDSFVPIPAFPKSKFAGSAGDRINSAFMYGSQNGQGLTGGFQLLAGTIQNLTGITFAAGAIIDFDGFKALVDELGGVNMCIDEKVTSIHLGRDSKGNRAAPFYPPMVEPPFRPVPGVKPEVYTPGCKHLRPWQALDYVRQRDIMSLNDGDYGRQRHQQQFVKAVFKDAVKRGLTDPTKLNGIIKALGKAVTVDMGGLSLEDWMGSMGNVRDLTLVKTNGGHFSQHLDANGRYAGEELNADSLALLESVKTDSVDGFLIAHPDWISQDK
jgi:LCP family protein required for cell wall assembly